MKNIKIAEFDKLLCIVSPYPGMTIFHMSDNNKEVCYRLEEFCEQNEYVYDLVCADEEFIKELKEGGFSKARKITYNQQRYNRHSRLYDFIFINIDFSSLENQKLFLKKIYAIAKNGAKILFFFPKNKTYEQFERALEEGYFVAINPIEDIFENHAVLTAQKMHGWGENNDR